MNIIQESSPKNKFCVSSNVDVVCRCHFKEDDVEIIQVGVAQTGLNPLDHISRGKSMHKFMAKYR